MAVELRGNKYLRKISNQCRNLTEKMNVSEWKNMKLLVCNRKIYIFVIKHEVYLQNEIYLITRSGGNSDFKQWFH